MTKLIEFFNTSIHVETYIADNFKAKLLGYMFKKEPHHEAILFKNCNSVHTFFMNFPIDILFLDQNYKILRKMENCGKGQVIRPVKDAFYVLESPSGSFGEVEEGDLMHELI